MVADRETYMRILAHGFIFGMTADTLGLIQGAWVYKFGLIVPAIGYPLSMLLFYHLRPRVNRWLTYLALGVYAHWTEMTVIILGLMQYTIAGDLNKIPIGGSWMPRAIFVWPLISLVFYSIAVDLPSYLRGKIDPKLAELASGILQLAYSVGFVTLYMKVLAFVI